MVLPIVCKCGGNAKLTTENGGKFIKCERCSREHYSRNGYRLIKRIFADGFRIRFPKEDSIADNNENVKSI